MKSLEEYIEKASKNGHVRSGMVLGIRLALLGLKEVGIEDPHQHHRSLVVIVETDRCLPDAIELITGCRLGNRTLKFNDLGKMAATFQNLGSDHAVRVSTREAANQLAHEMFPDLDKDEALGRAYRVLSNTELFTCQSGHVELNPEDIPGYWAPRVICAMCEEGIAFNRQLIVDGRTICRSCAGQRYFKPS